MRLIETDEFELAEQVLQRTRVEGVLNDFWVRHIDSTNFSDVQLYIQIKAKDWKNPANQILERSLMDHRNDDIGVQKVYRVKTSHNKKMKSRLPIIFMAKLSKGAKPIFINYEILRAQHPYLLIDFFQKRALFREFQDDEKGLPPPHHQQFIDHHIENKDIYHQIKKEDFERSSKGKKMKTQSKEPIQKRDHREIQEVRQVKEVREVRESRQQKELRQLKKSCSISADSRPMRTCRLRSDFTKDHYPEQKELVQQSHQRLKELSQSLRSEPYGDIKEESKHELKNILDYDYLVQSSFCLNLISPAVIPSIKLKPEQLMPQPLVPYQIPRINFKQIERDQYSSQQFKDSQESQFLLDDRGKEKRKRERMMMLRELQRQKQRNKSRKIKKKVNPNSSHH